MATKTALGVGTVLALLLAAEVKAQPDICETLGLSGLTISSDTNCLQITGEVNYEFEWGDYATEANGATGQLADDFDVWNFSASFLPSVTSGGTATRGAYSTETPSNQLVVPGYTFDTSFRGTGIRGDVAGSLSMGGFPITLGGGLELNNAKAESSAANVAFPEGFGIPGVGPVNGAFINAPTDMLHFDFSARRRQLAAYLEAGVPLSEGQLMFADVMAGYRFGGLLGVRGGFFDQHETTQAVTFSPAFGMLADGTSTYETDLTGGFGGVYAGLSLDKNIPLGDGFSLQEMFSVTAGYNMYRLNVRDHIRASGPGGLSLNDTNSFFYTGGIPSVKLDATIGIGTADWMFGINTGLAAGETAQIDYKRLNDGGNPHVNLLPELGYSIGASLLGRY